MKKKIIVIIFFLMSSLELDANSWCIKEDRKDGEIYYGNCAQERERTGFRTWKNIYEDANDEEVASHCKKLPASGGCFKKNTHGQLFCKDYKDHHNGQVLEGGTCEE